jgi:hypothetical protein
MFGCNARLGRLLQRIVDVRGRGDWNAKRKASARLSRDLQKGSPTDIAPKRAVGAIHEIHCCLLDRITGATMQRRIRERPCRNAVVELLFEIRGSITSGGRAAETDVDVRDGRSK